MFLIQSYQLEVVGFSMSMNEKKNCELPGKSKHCCNGIIIEGHTVTDEKSNKNIVNADVDA